MILAGDVGGTKTNLALFAAGDTDLRTAIVEESFRAAGWDTQTFTNEHPDGILHAARSASVDFIGLSVGHDEAFCDLARFISLLRQESRNPEVKGRLPEGTHGDHLCSQFHGPWLS